MELRQRHTKLTNMENHIPPLKSDNHTSDEDNIDSGFSSENQRLKQRQQHENLINQVQTKSVSIHSRDRSGSNSLVNSNRPKISYEFTNLTSNIEKQIKTGYSDIILPGSLPLFSQGLNEQNFTLGKKLYLIFGAVFLLIPRLIIFIYSLIGMNLFGKLCSIGQPYTPEKPNITSWWRRIFLWLAIAHYRLLYIGLGVWWIKEKGTRAKFSEAPIAVAAPHKTIADTAFFGSFPFHNYMSPVSTDEFGIILNAGMKVLNPILVSTTNRESRKNVSKEITRRTDTNLDFSKKWNQILLFPEATCTNGLCLMNFKTGAFVDGLPVQPICIKSSNWINCSFTWIGYPAYINILILMLSFRTSIEIHYLDVYVPNEQEKKDPELFAYNVRKVMSKYSGMPYTDTDTVDGKLMFLAASKHKINPIYAFVGVLELMRKYNCNTKDIFEAFNLYFETFQSILDSKTGRIKMAKYDNFIESNQIKTWPKSYKRYKIEDASKCINSLNLVKYNNSNSETNHKNTRSVNCNPIGEKQQLLPQKSSADHNTSSDECGDMSYETITFLNILNCGDERLGKNNEISIKSAIESKLLFDRL